jgi:two-component system cell cycle sensor histidine kinase/response regulator CckA
VQLIDKLKLPPNLFANDADAVAHLRVLVVDDDDEDSAITQHALSEIPWFSCTVDSANSYATALEALRSAEYDVILLDHGLGARSGLELLREAFGDSLPVAVVLLTGMASHEVDEAASRAGISHLLEKSELRSRPLERSVRYALERTRIERELRSARAFFRTAFDALDDHVAILDGSGVIVEVNRAWAEFANNNGYPDQSAGRGENYFAICDAAAARGVLEAGVAATGLREVMAGERDVFTLLYPCHAPCEERWFQLHATRIAEGSANRLMVAHQDVTARLRAQRELTEREERYRLVGRATKDVLWDWDLCTDQVVWGEMASIAFGHDVSEASGDSQWWMSHVHADDLMRINDGLAQLLHGTDDTWSGEYRYRRSDGTYCEVLDRAYVLRDESGRGLRMIGSMTDLTEQRKAQARLRESETRYRLLFNSNPSPIWVSDDVTMRCISANDAALAQYGYTREEFLALTAYDIRVRDEWASLDHFAKSPPRGLRKLGLGRHRKKNGDVIDVDVMLHSIELGERRCQLVLATDVTERISAERASAAALREADLERRRLQATLDIMPVGVFITDAAGGVMHANKEARRIWGGSMPAVHSADDFRLFRGWFVATGEELAPEDWAAALALRTGAPVGAQLLAIARFDGTRGHVLNSATPIRDADGEVSGVVVINVDVSERQTQERERTQLLESLEFERNRLSGVFAQAPAFMAVLRGADHVFEMVNEAYIRLVGRNPLGHSVATVLPELEEQGLLALADGVLATGEPYVGTHVRVTMRPAPGVEVTHFVNFVFQPLAEADGSVSGVLVHGVDVTEQVDSEEALRQSEEQYRTLVELSPDGILIHVGGTIVFANSSAAHILRTRSPADIVGRKLLDLVYEDDTERMQERLATIRSGTDVPRTSLRWKTFDGAVRVMDLSSQGFQFEGRAAVHSVFRDTTDLRLMEEQLRQAQKMEAVGQLAGGVAHDFNNLLTVIKVNVEFLLEELGSENPCRAEVVEVGDAADRAADLTRQLLAFSRKQILQPRVLDCNKVVESVRPMLSRLIREDVVVEMHLANGLGCVMADAGQLEQVLLNLSVNARDAMPNGGRLLIETAEIVLSADWESEDRSVVVPGRYVMVTVSDTGTGIMPADRLRMFEPFFTTKPVGQGTGLGLATVYGIVKQSGGHLHVDSVPNHGTTISVYLPVVPDSEKVSGDVAEARDTLGVETILVVEDMDALRMIARRVLARSGYTVLEARNGREALEQSRAHAGAIDLVLTDVIMPEMNGVRLVQALKEERPAMRVLFMSGYADDEVARHEVTAATAAFISKPFSPTGLLEVVRAALDA